MMLKLTTSLCGLIMGLLSTSQHRHRHPGTDTATAADLRECDTACLG